MRNLGKVLVLDGSGEGERVACYRVYILLGGEDVCAPFSISHFSSDLYCKSYVM